MRHTTTLLASALLVTILTSCGENQPPKSQQSASPAQNQNLRPNFFADLARATPQYSSNAIASPGATAPGGTGLNLNNVTLPPAGSGTTKPPVEPTLNIPPDAEWTIACSTVTTPDRFTRVPQQVNYLSSRSPFKQWYTVHGERESTLYHGFYRSAADGRPDKAAQADRKAIAQWTDEHGQLPFARCILQKIIPPDPPAPTEWNLANAPEKAYWSLQIAAFKDNPRRKEAAVLAVQELRAKGIEAFFYHGQTISSVCLGAFPMSALKEQEADGSKAIFQQDDAVLVTDTPLTDRYGKAREITDREGNRVRTLTQRIEVADPALLAMMQSFPQHTVNYKSLVRQVRGADGVVKEVPTPSFLVTIPRQEQSVLNQTAQPGAWQGFERMTPTRGPGTVDGPGRIVPPTTPGGGSLRRLD